MPQTDAKEDWFERVWEKRDGRWQWLSHRTVWGPHPSPAGVDATQIPAETPANYVPGLPAAKAVPATYKPQSKDVAELLTGTLRGVAASLRMLRASDPASTVPRSGRQIQRQDSPPP